MNTDHSAMMCCGWGIKAGWLIPFVDIPFVDKRVIGR